MAVPYLETEIDISTFLNRGRLPDLYLKINLFKKYFANILTEKPFLFYAHRNDPRNNFCFKKTGTRRMGRKNRFHGGGEDIETEERKTFRRSRYAVLPPFRSPAAISIL